MRRTAPEAPDGDSAPATSPPQSSERIPRSRTRTVMAVGTVFTLVMVAAAVWLGVAGVDAARRVTGGATTKVVTDPNAPGYVAAVDASPVHLVAITDGDDKLSAFVEFVPGVNGAAGTIIWTLGELVVDRDGTDVSLGQVYGESGVAEARALLEAQLGFGSTDVIVVGPRQLADAAASLGELQVRNPDAVTTESNGKREVVFPAGTIPLKPDELGKFLTTRGAGEVPENRSTRAEALFDEMIAALHGNPTPPTTTTTPPTTVKGSKATTTTSKSGSTVAGGSAAGSSKGSTTTGSVSSSASSSTPATSEAGSGSGTASTTTAKSAGTSGPAATGGSTTDSGPPLAETLKAMGTSTPDFIVLPTKRVAFRGSYLYRPDAEATAKALDGVVKFPISAFPGQRPRVRILNGTSDLSAANSVAPQLAAAGGEVLLVGNADSLDVATTTVVYSDPSFEAIAKKIADIVGTTATKSDQVSDAADIDVVLGADHT